MGNLKQTNQPKKQADISCCTCKKRRCLSCDIELLSLEKSIFWLLLLVSCLASVFVYVCVFMCVCCLHMKIVLWTEHMFLFIRKIFSFLLMYSPAFCCCCYLLKGWVSLVCAFYTPVFSLFWFTCGERNYNISIIRNFSVLLRVKVCFYPTTYLVCCTYQKFLQYGTPHTWLRLLRNWGGGGSWKEFSVQKLCSVQLASGCVIVCSCVDKW